MFNYDVYLKVYIGAYDTTAGMNFKVKGSSQLEAAKTAKEINKGKKIYYIEVANLDEREPITFFDGETLEVFKEII